MFKLARNIIRETVDQFPEVKPFLTEQALKAVGGFLATIERYYQTIYDAVKGYLESTRPVTAFRNQMLVAMAESFTDAVYTGYQEGGGEIPLDDDTANWLGEQIASERGHIVDLFERLRDVRSQLQNEPYQELAINSEATSRAEGYTKTLGVIYQEAKMRGSKNKTLVFGGNSGKESCPECQKLLGKRHRISWILANDMIPRPGNDRFTCKGYRCEHAWYDPVTGDVYSF